MTSFAKSLGLSLALLSAGALACTDDLGSDDEGALETGDTGDTGAEGMCLDNPTLTPRVSVSFNGTTSVPDADLSCELISAALDEGVLEVELACPYEEADPNPAEVRITTPAQSLPAGLEPGAALDLHLYDGFEIGDPDLELVLSDAEGPIIAAVHYAYGPTDWGSVSVRFSSYCETDPEDLEPERYGFVRAEIAATEEEVDVFVGMPELISDGVHEWDLHAITADDFCCHGPIFTAEMVRR